MFFLLNASNYIKRYVFNMLCNSNIVTVLLFI